jgi:hypothetical protein
MICVVDISAYPFLGGCPGLLTTITADRQELQATTPLSLSPWPRPIGILLSG